MFRGREEVLGTMVQVQVPRNSKEKNETTDDREKLLRVARVQVTLLRENKYRCRLISRAFDSHHLFDPRLATNNLSKH